MKRLALLLLTLTLAFSAAHAQTASKEEPVAFFYTATWDSGTSKIIPATLQRIQLTSAQYDEAKSKFIEAVVSKITAPAAAAVAGAVPGVAAPTPAPTPPAPGATPAPGAAQAQINLSLDPKVTPEQAPLVFAFDVAPLQVAVGAGNDPHTLAEWTFFYWQEMLWENYISRGTLLLPDVMTSSDLDHFVQVMNSTRTPIWTFCAETDPKTKEPKEWTQSNHDFPKLTPAADEDSTAATAIKTAAASTGGILDPQVPAQADANLKGLMSIYREAAYAMDCMSHDQYWGVLNNLHSRQDERDKYAEWLGDRKTQVQEYAKDWAHKYDGTEFNVDGVQFLVSEKKPMENVPPNSRNIVIDKAVVPYDLLNADGTLKRPVKTQD